MSTSKKAEKSATPVRKSENLPVAMRLKREGFVASADLGFDVSQNDNPTFVAKGLALSFLPYKPQFDAKGNFASHYIHKTQQVELTMFAHPSVGVPYGPLARLILAYLAEYAVKTHSRIIVLDDSISKMLERFGMYNNSTNRKALRQQLNAICKASLLFTWSYERGRRTGEMGLSYPFVSRFNLWKENDKGRRPNKSSDDEPEEGAYLELSEYFFAQVQGAVPLDATSLVELRNAMAIDIYAFFTYQTYGLRKAKFYDWEELHQQFGQSYSRIRAFKPQFLKNVEIVLSKCDDFMLAESEDGKGIWLIPEGCGMPEMLPAETKSEPKKLAESIKTAETDDLFELKP